MDSPVTFPNGRTARNRFALASMTTCQSNPDGTLHDQELEWLKRRAEGGYGIINTCCVHVQANGKGWEGELGCFDDSQMDGYKRLAEAIHGVDPSTLLIVQLFHIGMRGDEKLIEGPARSCVDMEYHHRGIVTPAKGLTEAEIETLIDDFVKACQRCQQAGCDGVELHAAHGHIFTQFLCPVLNTRQDHWGGKSLENRARLLRTVLQRARKACAKDFLIGVRLSPEPTNEKAGGWNMDPDENLQVAQWLVQDGADFISISIFGHSPTKITEKHKDLPDPKPLIQVFRDALPKEQVVVMCCGGVKSGKDVQTLLDMGVDLAVTGSTAIGTPDFPNHCIANPAFEATNLPPWTPEYLESVQVTPPFVDFLVTLAMVKKE